MKTTVEVFNNEVTVTYTDFLVSVETLRGLLFELRPEQARMLGRVLRGSADEVDRLRREEQR